MYYLCGIFAPHKSFFYEDREFYAAQSEWVEADKPVNAVRKYKQKHMAELGAASLAFTRVLTEAKSGKGVKDGKKDIERATTIMDDYYDIECHIEEEAG